MEPEELSSSLSSTIDHPPYYTKQTLILTYTIAPSNPNNPIGNFLPSDALHKIVNLAKGSGNIPILSDEVYRPLFHSLGTSTHPPSIIDIYDHGIATGSMSKAFSLAGLRVGWIAARQHKVIDACASARDYNTISVSQLDDTMATHALSPSVVSKILERNVALCNTNLNILDDFITRVPEVSDGKFNASYIKPTAGTTAFVKFERKDGETVDDKRFCEELLERKGIMFLPGGVCFGHGEEFAGYFRIGYCCGTQVLKAGLKGVGEFLREEF
jgi:aspartate/methionine/tyrosine aminotransferase